MKMAFSILAAAAWMTTGAITLENDRMKLVFREAQGMGLTQIVNKLDGREVSFGADTERIDFWQLHFVRPGKFTKAGTPETFSVANRSPAKSTRVERDERGATFVWEGISLSGDEAVLDVRARVELPPGDHESIWTISVDNRSTHFPLSVVWYPMLRQVGKPGGADVLVPHSNLGARLMKRRGYKQGKEADRVKRCGYMGYEPMVAAFLQEGAGVSVVAQDPKGYIKTISIDGRNSVWFETPVENAGVVGKAAGSTKYPVAVDAFRGDWWQVAKQYRRWALRQVWASKGPIRSRSDYPKAMAETPLWLNVRAGTDVVVSNMLAAARRHFPDFATGLHWHGWNKWGHDTHYPEMFPTVTNVEETIGFTHSIGQHTMIYTNGRLWDAEIPSYELARPWMVRRADGLDCTERYANKRLQGVMCPATGFWQDTLVGLAVSITGPRLGSKGLFMDQIGAADPALCYNPLHGHTLGGGTYWFDGYRALLKRAHAVTFANGGYLTTEGTAETWMDLVDGYLCVTRWTPEDVPFYPAVYSGYTTYFGSPQGDDDTPEAFWALQARQVLAGVVPGWFNPCMVLSERTAGISLKREMIGRLCRLRQENLDFFAYGELLDELRTVEPPKTVHVFWHGRWSNARRSDEFDMPAVIGAKWRSFAGDRTALFVANLSTEEQTVTLANEGFEGRKVVLKGLSVDKICACEKR